VKTFNLLRFAGQQMPNCPVCRQWLAPSKLSCFGELKIEWLA